MRLIDKARESWVAPPPLDSTKLAPLIEFGSSLFVLFHVHCGYVLHVQSKIRDSACLMNSLAARPVGQNSPTVSTLAVLSGIRY